MEIKDKKKLEKYPSFFSNKKTEALEKAFKIFNEAFDEYAKKHNLSQHEIIDFKNMVLKSYIERKAALYLESKILMYSSFLENSIDLACNNSFNSKEINECSKIFYYKNKKHTIFHE